MSNPELTRGGSDLKTPNAQKSVNVRTKDLPLHCPQAGSSLWDSHPRVYLPIEDAVNQCIICPYCGTEYKFIE